MLNKNSDIVAISAVRTPIGRFGGTLKDVKAYELGAVAIREAVNRSGIAAGNISEVIYGNCRQAGNGPNPARSAALLAGLKQSIPSTTVNMACPSGMKTIMISAASIAAGQSDYCVAGGMDSMSTIPHMIQGLRFKQRKLGDLLIEDGWKDATDPVAETTMGKTAEALAEKYNITREQQDKFALESHRRAVAAAESGLFTNETVAIDLVPAFNHGAVFLTADETPRSNTSLKKLSELPPAFSAAGSVTAGNSSAMSDGACALVLTKRELAQSKNITPLFSITAQTQAAVDGAVMGEGPAVSIPAVLKQAGMTINDIDLIEINEAFASQIIANIQTLNLDRSRLNVNGGAIALGHPTGISGARIVITLANALKAADKETGLAAICGAGGVTTAIIIRREN
jgi:acetyl-CoA C-acetyltransferase